MFPEEDAARYRVSVEMKMGGVGVGEFSLLAAGCVSVCLCVTNIGTAKKLALSLKTNWKMFPWHFCFYKTILVDMKHGRRKCVLVCIRWVSCGYVACAVTPATRALQNMVPLVWSVVRMFPSEVDSSRFSFINIQGKVVCDSRCFWHSTDGTLISCMHSKVHASKYKGLPSLFAYTSTHCKCVSHESDVPCCSSK